MNCVNISGMNEELKMERSSAMYGVITEHPLEDKTTHLHKEQKNSGKQGTKNNKTSNVHITAISPIKKQTIDFNSSIYSLDDVQEERYYPNLDQTERNYRTCDQIQPCELNQSLCKNEGDWNVKIQPEIMVKTAGDMFPCDITGSCFVPYDNLIVADYSNKSVKLLSSTHCNVKFMFMLKHEPWAVAYNPDDGEIAVSVPKEGILYILCIQLSGGLIVNRTIGVEKQCRAVVYHRGRLIISYGHYKLNVVGKIQIVDINGVVLRSIEGSITGETLFDYPSHVAVSLDQCTLYVTDFKKAKVLALKLDLTDSTIMEPHIIQQDIDYIQDPRGITVDGSGNVYVCDYTSGSIHVFNDKLENIKVLAGRDDGIVNPRTLAYDTRHDKLYVGMFYNRFLRVFEIRHSKCNYDNEAFII